MKLESQVCSLELAKKLKSLGVKQESLFFWCKTTDEKEFWLLFGTPSGGYKSKPDEINISKWKDGKGYSAFTVAELGEMLPNDYYSYKRKDNMWWCIYADNDNECECCGQDKDYMYSDTEAKTEADARAKLLIYLIENNLLNNPILLSGEKE